MTTVLPTQVWAVAPVLCPTGCVTPSLLSADQDEELVFLGRTVAITCSLNTAGM